MPKLKARAKTLKRKKLKLTYSIVATGKVLRAVKRFQKKKAMESNLISPLGKMRSRQERKAMAKTLKIPFTPRYNGVVLKKKFSLEVIQKKDRTTTYLHLVSEVM